MRVCIHRGTEQVGGTCIEIKSGGKRVVLDVGMPLDVEPENAEAALPAVHGFREPADDLLAALISHPHQDHVGLVRHLRADLPVAIGAAAQRLLDRASSWLDQPKLEGRPIMHWRNGIPGYAMHDETMLTLEQLRSLVGSWASAKRSTMVRLRVSAEVSVLPSSCR
jgi:mRNA degradation ribonuclease J1/J2